MFENSIRNTHQNPMGQEESIEMHALSVITQQERDHFATPNGGNGLPDLVNLFDGKVFLNYYFALDPRGEFSKDNDPKGLLDADGAVKDTPILKSGSLRPDFKQNLARALKEKFHDRYEVIDIYDTQWADDGLVAAAFALVEGFDPEQSVGDFLHEHEETFMAMKNIMDEDHEDYFMNLATRA